MSTFFFFSIGRLSFVLIHIIGPYVNSALHSYSSDETKICIFVIFFLTRLIVNFVNPLIPVHLQYKTYKLFVVLKIQNMSIKIYGLQKNRC